MKKTPVAVIGDGGVSEQSSSYQTAFKLGTLLVENNYRIITGGLYGVMEAAPKGAYQAKNYQDGDTVGVLPSYNIKSANPYIDIPIATGLGLARNILVANSPAVIAIGGGSGTLSEMALAWQQNRLILAWQGDGWSEALATNSIDSRPRMFDWNDQVFGFETPEEAIELINHFLPKYINAL